MENMDDLKQHTEDVTSATGSAKQMFDEAYSGSLDAKIQDLKRSFEGLYGKMMSSSSLGTMISGATQLISALSGVNGKALVVAGTVGALTLASEKFKTSMTSFQPTFITNAVGKFKEWETSLSGIATKTKESIVTTKSFITSQEALSASTMLARGKLLDLQASLVVVKAGEIACAVAGEALQMAFSMGMGIAVMSVISGLGQFVSNLGKTQSTMESCKEQSETLSNSLKGIKNENDLISQYKDLSEQLKDTNKTEEERKTINDQIKSVKEQLSSSESEYAGILNDENLTLDQQIAKMDQIKKKKLFDESSDVDKKMGSQGTMEDESKKLEDLTSNYNKLKEAMSVGDTETANNILSSSNFRNIDEMQNSIITMSGDIDKYNQNVNNMKDANYATSRSTISLSDSITEFNKSVSADSLVNSISKNSSLISQSMSEMKSNGSVGAETIKKLSSAFPQLGINADNVQSSLNKLNTALSMQGSSNNGLITTLATSMVSADGTIKNMTNDIVGSLQNIQQEADGTKSGILKIDNTEFKIKFNADGTINNLNEVKDAIDKLHNSIKLDTSNNADSNMFLTSLRKSVVDTSGTIKDVTGNIVANLKNIQQQADGTMSGILNVNGQEIYVKVNKDGTIQNLDDIQKAIDDLPKETTTKITVNGEELSTVDDAKKKLDEIAQDNPNATITINGEQIGTIDEAKEKLDNIPPNTNTVIQADNADANSKAEDTTQKLDAIPPQTNTNVNVNTNGAESKLQSIKSYLDGIDGRAISAVVNVAENVAKSVSGGDSSSPITPQTNATGTNSFDGSSSNGWTWINEGNKGELVTLPDGTKIIPHDLSEKMIEENAKNDDDSSAKVVNNQVEETISVTMPDLYSVKVNPDKLSDYYNTSNDDSSSSSSSSSSKTKKTSSSSSSDSDSSSSDSSSSSSDEKAQKKAESDAKKAEEDAKKAQEELVKSEKDSITKVTDAWDEAKWRVNSNIKDIETQESELGEDSDDNWTQKMSLLNDKLTQQKSLLNEDSLALIGLEQTSVTTDEAQEELKKKIQSATDEIQSQKKAVADLNNELSKDYLEQIKKTIQKEEEIAKLQKEAKDDAQQKELNKTTYNVSESDWQQYQDTVKKRIQTELDGLKDNADLQSNDVVLKDAILSKETELKKVESQRYSDIKDFQSAYESIHNEQITSLSDQITAIEKQEQALDDTNTATEEANTLLEKQNTLKQDEIDLDRLKNQQTIKTYSKQTDGTWQFTYSYDKTAVKDKQKEVDEAQKDLTDTQNQQALEAQKKALETQKSNIEKEKQYETDLMNTKKDLYNTDLDNLKSAQEKETKALENYYSDIDTLAKSRLQEIGQRFNNDLNAMLQEMIGSYTVAKETYEKLNDLNINGNGLSDVYKATQSGNIGAYESTKGQSSDELLAKIKSNNSEAETEYSRYYDSVESSQSDNESSTKKKVDSIVDKELDGLEDRLNNLKDKDSEIENELDSHNQKVIDKQNQTQETLVSSAKEFSTTYTILVDKFLEVLQEIYDFRFNNIIENVQGATEEIVGALVVSEKAYEKYAEAWNAMHPKDAISSSIDISSVIATNSAYQKSVAEWETSKLAKYTTDAFDKYTSQIGNGISDSILNKLNNYSTNNSVSNSGSATAYTTNKTTTNSKQVNINGAINVNTENASDLIDQLLSIAENKTKTS
jgi:chromosome segregation ATPase